MLDNRVEIYNKQRPTENQNRNNVIQNFVMFLKHQQNVTAEKRNTTTSLNTISKFSNSSFTTYLNYRKNIQTRLAEINSNMSQMLIESCSGIDNICNRVRGCFSDMPETERTTEDIMTEDIDEYEIEELKSKSTEENIDTLEEITEVSLEESQTEQPAEKTNFKTENIKVTKSFTPFFTIISTDNISLNKTCAINSHKVKNKSTSRAFRKKIQKRNDILNAFRNTIVNKLYFEHDEVMDKLIANIHDEIENFSNTTIFNAKKLPAENTNNKPEDLTSKPSDVQKKRFSFTNKNILKTQWKSKCIQVDHYLPESGFDVGYLDMTQFESTLPPDVYPRPGSTDLFKKLKMQIEANDSFICFQKLMSRKRSNVEKCKSNLKSENTLLDVRTINSLSGGNITKHKNLKESKIISRAKLVEDPSANNSFNKRPISSRTSVRSCVKLTRNKNSINLIAQSRSSVRSNLEITSKSFIRTAKLKNNPKKNDVLSQSRSPVSKVIITKNTNLKSNSISTSRGSVRSNKNLAKSKNSIHQSRSSIRSNMKSSTSKNFKMTKLLSQSKLVDLSSSKKAVTDRTSISKVDLKKKYSDSLWFSQKHLIRKPSSRHQVRKRKRQYSEMKSPKSFSNFSHPKSRLAIKETEVLPRIKPIISCDISRYPKSSHTHSCSTTNAQESTRLIGSSCKLIVKNERPPSFDMKCRLRWMCIKNAQARVRKLEYLDILDDLTIRDLLPLKSEYPRKDYQGMEENQYQNKTIQDTYLYKLLYGKQSTKNMWNHLLQPSIECSEKNCKLCGRERPRSRSKRNAKRNEKANKIHEPNYNDHTYPRPEVIKRLSPYMYDPHNYDIQNISMTIMPVRVFYDNYKTEKPITKLKSSRNSSPAQKLPLVPMKEAKGPLRAKWSSPVTSNPMKVVYDSVSKNSDTPAVPTKPMIQSARVVEEKCVVQRKSKSYSPKAFAPYCNNGDKQNLKKQATRVARDPQIEKKAKQNVKKNVQEKSMSDSEKKLWANKYGKNVGQQLVSFIKKQKPEGQVALPKYAVPVIKKNASKETKRIFDSSRNSSRHKQMLSHLQGLKQKNDEIQNNIQKAIDVIETKMVDILSDAGNSSSVHAFDAMEKEITNVLSMMKCNRRISRTVTPKTAETTDSRKTEILEEDINLISAELFKKLENILDSERSMCYSSETVSSKKTDINTSEIKTEPTRKTRIDSKPQSSSSTSLKKSRFATVWPCIRSNHSREKTVKVSKLSTTTEFVTHVEASKSQNDWESAVMKSGGDKKTKLTIEEIYATGENFDLDDTSKLDEYVYSLSYDLTNNSRGDCMMQVVKSQESIIISSDIGETFDKVLSENQYEIEIKNSKSIEEIVENCNEVVKNQSTNDLIDDIKTVLPEAQVLTDKEREPDLEQQTEQTVSANISQKKELNRLDESFGCSKVLPECDTEAEESNSFSENVHKIIRRVEDIYTHLEEIHLSNIPVFKDKTEVPNIDSGEFVTPFMQAVKERKRPHSPMQPPLQNSSSYYNVLSFLDTLSDIQCEKPIEVHTARLCYYVHLCHLPDIFYRATLKYFLKRSDVEKPSCLKKSSNEIKSKHKKVSFLVMKENKSSQVAMCPLHKFKVLKVSSQQFPPKENRGSPEDSADNAVEANKSFSCCNQEKVLNKNQLEASDDDLCTDTSIENNPDLSSETNPDISGTHYSTADSYEETTLEMSELDRLTQVYCQVQKDEASKAVAPFDNSKEKVPECPDHLPDVSERTDTSKSSENISLVESPQIQVFYNKSDESIPKVILRNGSYEGFYGQETILQVKNSLHRNLKVKPKIVLFKEIGNLSGLLQPLKNLDKFSDKTIVKKRLENRKEMRLSRKASCRKFDKESSSPVDEENKVLLKSFYALVYILMFTALNLEYRCV